MTTDDVAANRGARPTDLSPSPPLRFSPSPSSDANEMTTMCSSKRTNVPTSPAGPRTPNRVFSSPVLLVVVVGRRVELTIYAQFLGMDVRGDAPGFHRGIAASDDGRWVYRVVVLRDRQHLVVSSDACVAMKRCWLLRFSVLWSGREGKKRHRHQASTRSLAFFSSPMGTA